MGTFVYDETSLASLTGFIGEGGAKEAGTNNKIIVFLFHLSHTMSLCFISQKAEGRKMKPHTDRRFMGSPVTRTNGRCQRGKAN